MPLGFGAIGQFALGEYRRASAAAASLLDITSDNILQLPINCVLNGQQLYEKSGRTAEIPHRQSVKTTPVFKRSGLRKL